MPNINPEQVRDCCVSGFVPYTEDTYTGKYDRWWSPLFGWFDGEFCAWLNKHEQECWIKALNEADNLLDQIRIVPMDDESCRPLKKF